MFQRFCITFIFILLVSKNIPKGTNKVDVELNYFDQDNKEYTDTKTIYINNVQGSEGDLGKGSGRSIPGFDLYEALSRCNNNVEKFGGHSMAIGIGVDKDKFENFKNDLYKRILVINWDWIFATNVENFRNLFFIFIR